MPPDIPGVGASPRLLPSSPIGPAVSPGAVPPGPVSPVAPSTAIVPVTPTGTRGSSATSSPLGRSGLDLLDVIGTTDLLVERGTVAPVELNVGLETARGALLRGLAAESLATLDGVWERAQLTEEGWYLRSGALTMLGLPGEAERVSTEALQRKPSSVALRFMQSLARLASGDVSGARGAIGAAIEQPSTHPVVLMQQVIVLARQGHLREAERLLQQVMWVFPDHPAVDFARTSLRSIAADHTRSTSRSAFGGGVEERAPFTTGDYEVFETFGAAAGDVPPEPDVVDQQHGRIVADGLWADAPGDGNMDNASGTVAERAVARLGARLALLSVADAVREGRVLIRAFSAGGAMAGACTPEQAHAARGVLTAIVFALNQGGAPSRVIDGGAPLEVLLSQWLPLMQAERFDDAARVLRRLGASIPDAQRRLLAACVPRPLEVPSRDEREPPVLSFGAVEYEGPVQGEPATGPLIPVRLGLALLEERAAERAAERAPVAALSGWMERPREVSPVEVMPARATSLPRVRDDGAGMRIAALLCVAVAAGAGMSGSGTVAVAFGVGAAWLGLRRSGRSEARPDGARHRARHRGRHRDRDRDTTGVD